MIIELTQSGGLAYLPGLNKPVVIDTAGLDQATQSRLEHLVEDMHFFDLPANVGMPKPGSADYHYQTLTIEHNAQRHTVRMLVPIVDDRLQELVQFLKTIKR